MVVIALSKTDGFATHLAGAQGTVYGRHLEYI